MTTRDELKLALKAMPGVDAVTVVGDHNLIATVVSASFRQQDEALRQESARECMEISKRYTWIEQTEQRRVYIYQHTRGRLFRFSPLFSCMTIPY